MDSLRTAILFGVSTAIAACGATQINYSGSEVTGELKLTATSNVLKLARADAGQPTVVKKMKLKGLEELLNPPSLAEEFSRARHKRVHPRLKDSFGLFSQTNRATSLRSTVLPVGTVQELTVAPRGGSSFEGLTQLDQRMANHGNQYTVEPPNPSIAVAEGYVLEGVNNAIQVYDTSGNALLPQAIATNELFGLAPAIERQSGAYGPFPTDMRVFYDKDIERWMVLQRAQDVDVFGNPISTSHIYLAVSQTEDPTGSYNIYTADTTDLQNQACPCLDDYPQIGADRYGFYISSNRMNSDSEAFVDASILAISKGSLRSGASTPTAFRFVLPFNSGYEFAVQPATTPPKASYLLADGGVEYFASTVGDSSAGNTVAVWAMANTSSLAQGNPSLTLTQTSFSTLTYSTPPVATQPEGDRPYGASLNPPGPLPFIDGGDTRVLSASYAAGRLYLTFSTSALDSTQKDVVAGVLMVLAPSLRAGTLNARILQQTYMVVKGNNILRPSVAINAEGEGDIAATLVGPSYFPSASFVPVSTFSLPRTLHIAGAGVAPEDGFTGYTGGQESGTARWGDYSTAVASGNGDIWLVNEYIGNLPRTAGANWDTLITRRRDEK